MDDDADEATLLAGWRAGQLSRESLYLLVRPGMRQRARQGLRGITGSTPTEQDVEEAVFRAFAELEKKDPNTVGSPIGLARAMAYRRGQDVGREVNRDREQIRGLMRDPAMRQELEPQDKDIVYELEREELAITALDCLQSLTQDQRLVVEQTVIGHENLSDWAQRQGKSHQAAGRQRERALAALRRCIDLKRTARKDGEEGTK